MINEILEESLYEKVKQLEKENAELKAQIEKMKCCGNCKYCYEEKYDGINCDLYDGKTYIPDIEKRNCDKWKLAG